MIARRARARRCSGRATGAAQEPPSASLDLAPAGELAPPGYRRTAAEVLRDGGGASRACGEERAAHPRSYLRAYLLPPRPLAGRPLRAAGRSRASAARRSPGSSSTTGPGASSEVWTGPQVAWRMARGLPGEFGRAVNSPWIWIALCVAFVAPFARLPLRMLHLDLAVLLAFGVSYAFFGAARHRRLGPVGISACSRISSRACSGSRSGRPETAPFRPLLPDERAALRPRGRAGVPRRAERRERQRDRRRLRRRGRRRPPARRRARCTAGSPPTSRTATRTARSSTRRTFPGR